MGVDRIIFLLVVARVVENRAASYASGGLTCEGSRLRYQFVLNPTANEFSLLTDLAESAKSAVVSRPTIDGEPVRVLVSPEHFREFKRKFQALKVYRSHSLQCADEATNPADPETSAPRSATAMWTELSGTMKANSSARVTMRLTPFSAKEHTEKTCGRLDDCVMQIAKVSSKKLSKNVSTSRITRASRTTAKPPKKRKSKPKSVRKSFGKLAKGKFRGNVPREQNKSTKGNDTRRGNAGARKTTTAHAGKKKKTSIPPRASSTEKSWSRLMNMATKSLTKSIDTSTKANLGKEVKTSTATNKSFSSGKQANARKAIAAKKANRAEAKNARKSTQRPKSSVATQQRKPSWKGGRKSALISKLTARKGSARKSRQRNRDRREINVFAGSKTRCGGNNFGIMKRSVGNHGKQDFTFNLPIACTVIRISSSCDSDCSEDTIETSAKEDVTGEISSEREESAPEAAQPQPGVAPDEPAEIMQDDPVKSPVEADDDNQESGNAATEQPEDFYSGSYDDYDEAPEDREEGPHPAVPAKDKVKNVQPGRLPQAIIEYQDVPNPASEENLAMPPQVFQPGDSSQLPISPKDHVGQFKGFGSPWHAPHYPRPPFELSTATSRPNETLERPEAPKKPFLSTLGSVNEWTKPPEAPEGGFYDESVNGWSKRPEDLSSNFNLKPENKGIERPEDPGSDFNVKPGNGWIKPSEAPDNNFNVKPGKEWSKSSKAPGSDFYDESVNGWPKPPKTPGSDFSVRPGKEWTQPPEASGSDFNAKPGNEWTKAPEAPGSGWTKPPEAPGSGWTKPPEAPGSEWTKPPEAPGSEWTKPPEAPGSGWTKPPNAPGSGWTKPPEAPGSEWIKPPEAPGSGWTKPPEAPGSGWTKAPEAPGSGWTKPPEAPGSGWTKHPEAPGSGWTKPPEAPGSDFNIKPVNEWIKPPEAPGSILNVPGESEEEDEDDDEAGEEEDYGNHFEADKIENGLDATIQAPVPTQTSIKPEENLKEVSSMNEADDKEDLQDNDGDYSDDNEEYNGEDYGKDYDNEEDYVEEAGNTELSDEDDYDLDED